MAQECLDQKAFYIFFNDLLSHLYGKYPFLALLLFVGPPSNDISNIPLLLSFVTGLSFVSVTVVHN